MKAIVAATAYAYVYIYVCMLVMNCVYTYMYICLCVCHEFNIDENVYINLSLRPPSTGGGGDEGQRGRNGIRICLYIYVHACNELCVYIHVYMSVCVS